VEHVLLQYQDVPRKNNNIHTDVSAADVVKSAIHTMGTLISLI